MFVSVISTLLKPGKVAVIPTDTVYGLAARAVDGAAVSRMYNLKQREAKPGTVIAATIEQLVALGIKRRYLTAVEQFWPGQVSVVVPCADPKLAYLHQGKQSLAVRIPADEALRDLLLTTGPLVTSSANNPGEPTATTAVEARHVFGDSVDVYADGGDLSGRQASTIVRVVDDALEVIRQGAVKITD